MRLKRIVRRRNEQAHKGTIVLGTVYSPPLYRFNYKFKSPELARMKNCYASISRIEKHLEKVDKLVANTF
jgi:hypothetical protein